MSISIVKQPVASDPSFLAALHVLGRSALHNRRHELETGQHEIDVTCRISGLITVDNDSEVLGNANYLTCLAFVFASLSERQRKQLAKKIADEIDTVSDEELADARKLCEPTRQPSTRSGAVRGILKIDVM